MSPKYKIPTPVDVDIVEPHHIALDPRIDNERSNGYACTASYVNGTGHNVVITNRTGIAVTLRPSQAIPSGEFHVYINYRLGNNAVFTPHSLIRQATESLPADLRAIKISLERLKKLDKPLFGECSTAFDIVYKVPKELFELYADAIHITPLGLTLSIPTDDDTIVVNPDSPKGRELLDGETPSIPGLSYRVEINDPDKRYGVRYLNIIGRVFRIDPTIDHTKVEGVYIYTNSTDVRPQARLKNLYDFADADTALRLYRSYEDALHHGDIAAQQTRDFETERHDMRMEALQAEQEKNATATQAALMKAMMDRFGQMEANAQKQHEMYVNSQQQLERQRDDQLKRDRDEATAQRNADRSDRESDRKEQLEYIKWCTAAATAVTVLLVILTKPNKKQS